MAIDVEAYRSALGDLALIDRRLMELALRRDKIFRQIEDRRAGLAVPPGGQIEDRRAGLAVPPGDPRRDQDLWIEDGEDA